MEWTTKFEIVLLHTTNGTSIDVRIRRTHTAMDIGHIYTHWRADGRECVNRNRREKKKKTADGYPIFQYQDAVTPFVYDSLLPCAYGGSVRLPIHTHTHYTRMDIVIQYGYEPNTHFHSIPARMETEWKKNVLCVSERANTRS